MDKASVEKLSAIIDKFSVFDTKTDVATALNKYINGSDEPKETWADGSICED